MKYVLDWGTFSPINHVRLVNRCYPTNPTEKSVPRANKLSTLIFYANSKPAKLTKISKYLMYKIQIDVALNKHGRNKISIDILTAILVNCQNFIHLFAVDFLKMIRMLLDGDSHAVIIKGTTSAFRKYCEAHHEEISYINDEIMKALNRILGRLSYLSKTVLSDRKDYIKQYEIQSSGLAGLTSLASMETFRGIGLPKRIEDFWSAIMHNVVLDDPVKVPSGSSKLMPDSDGTNPQQNLLSPADVEKPSLASLALHVLELLISQTTATTIPLLMEPFFSYLLDESKDIAVIIKIIERLVPKLQTRHLFLLLNQILDVVRSRLSHARVVKFFLSVLPECIRQDKLLNFPIVALVEPLLDISIIKDCPEANRSKVISIMELIASSAQLQPQVVHAISLFSKKIGSYSLQDVFLIKLPLTCGIHMISRLDSAKLGVLDYEDFKVIVSLCSHEDAGVRCLSLDLLYHVMKQSRGLEQYLSSLGPFMDLIYGGVLFSLLKNSTRLIDIWLCLRVLEKTLFNPESVITAAPHITSISQQLNYPHAVIISSYLSQSATILESPEFNQLKQQAFKVELTLPAFDTNDDQFYKKYNETLPATSDFSEQPLLNLSEILSRNEKVKSIKHHESILARVVIPYRDFKTTSVESSPTNVAPQSVDSDGTNETKVEKSLLINSYNTLSKPLSMIMTESVADFKKSLIKQRDSMDAGGVSPRATRQELLFDKISERNAKEKKKFEMTLEGL